MNLTLTRIFSARLQQKKPKLINNKQLKKKLINSIFTYLAVLALAPIALADLQSRIINGTPVKANQADFYVALLQQYSWGTGTHYNPICGAANLGDGQVLTAAHCVEALTGSKTLYLLFGDSSQQMHKEYCSNQGILPYRCTSDEFGAPDLNQFHFTNFATYTGDRSVLIPITATNVTIHPAYHRQSISNDIALIQLDRLVNHASVQLPSFDEFALAADNGEVGAMTVVGYGDTLSDNNSATFVQSPDLLAAQLNPKTARQCRLIWGGLFNSSNMICANGERGQDTCQGDSGGPLFKTDSNVLYGLTSFGSPKCGIRAGVYTRVFQFVDWIKQQPSPISGTGNNNSGTDSNGQSDQGDRTAENPLTETSPQPEPEADSSDANELNETETAVGMGEDKGPVMPWHEVNQPNSDIHQFQHTGALNLLTLLFIGASLMVRRPQAKTPKGSSYV